MLIADLAKFDVTIRINVRFFPGTLDISSASDFGPAIRRVPAKVKGDGLSYNQISATDRVALNFDIAFDSIPVTGRCFDLPI